MIGTGRKYGYFFLAILAVVSWWLVKISGMDDSRLPVPVHSADYFSTKYVKWEMDAAGVLKSQLQAEKMLHYHDDGTTYLQQPLIAFSNGKMPQWQVKSETGLLSADGKDLFLEGKAVIERGKAANARAIKITTTNLKVKPETSYAETDAWTELLSPPNLTTGMGMKLVFAQPIRLELLAKVKGKYEN